VVKQQQTRQFNDDLFSYEDLSSFFTFLKKNVNTLRKNLGKFEEPYSEISQNYKQILIKVLLPAVARSNLKIIASDTLLEIKAEQHGSEEKPKTFYRAIDLPSRADIKRTVAKYRHNTLQIIIPTISA
jgi:HSP20 family molecular chaperone IbpA